MAARVLIIAVWLTVAGLVGATVASASPPTTARRNQARIAGLAGLMNEQKRDGSLQLVPDQQDGGWKLLDSPL